MAKTDYKTWQSLTPLTADDLNQQVRDNGNAIWVGTTAGDMDYYVSAYNKTRIPIGSNGQTLKAIGGVPTWSNAIGCIQYSTQNTSVANGSNQVLTSISSLLENYDSNSFTSGTSDPIVTIPANLGGIYMITVSCQWASATANNTPRELGISHSGIYRGKTTVFNSYATAINQNVSLTFALSAGDTVTPIFTQLSGGLLNMTNFYLSVMKVG